MQAEFLTDTWLGGANKRLSQSEPKWDCMLALGRLPELAYRNNIIVHKEVFKEKLVRGIKMKGDTLDYVS